MTLRAVVCCVALSVLGSACATLPGPRVRFADVTEASLAELESEDNVWFEFEPGDEIPMVFVLTGMAEAATDAPIRFVAKRKFWIVQSRKTEKQYYSFDGKTVVTGDEARYSIMLGYDAALGPSLGVLLFVGEDSDLPDELKK